MNPFINSSPNLPCMTSVSGSGPLTIETLQSSGSQESPQKLSLGVDVSICKAIGWYSIPDGWFHGQVHYINSNTNNSEVTLVGNNIQSDPTGIADGTGLIVVWSNTDTKWHYLSFVQQG